METKIKMKFKNMNLNCGECKLVVCPGWAVELCTLDVTRIDDMVEFFTRVMRRKH